MNKLVGVACFLDILQLFLSYQMDGSVEEVEQIEQSISPQLCRGGVAEIFIPSKICLVILLPYGRIFFRIGIDWLPWSIQWYPSNTKIFKSKMFPEIQAPQNIRYLLLRGFFRVQKKTQDILTFPWISHPTILPGWRFHRPSLMRPHPSRQRLKVQEGGVQKSQGQPPVGCIKSPVNNGINYLLYQLVSRISSINSIFEEKLLFEFIGVKLFF